jgi:uncharacterized membrane protein
MTYLLWKLIHIAGVVAFLGNITTGLFWAAHAHRQGNFQLVASTFHGIIQSDRWFTIPGVFGILIGGFGAAINGSIPILRTGWIFWPIALFSISGLIFGLAVAPLQKRIRHLVVNRSQSEESWKEYCSLYKRWEIWGFLAWLTPVAAMVIMVLKPSLPGM